MDYDQKNQDGRRPKNKKWGCPKCRLQIWVRFRCILLTEKAKCRLSDVLDEIENFRIYLAGLLFIVMIINVKEV